MIISMLHGESATTYTPRLHVGLFFANDQNMVMILDIMQLQGNFSYKINHPIYSMLYRIRIHVLKHVSNQVILDGPKVGMTPPPPPYRKKTSQSIDQNIIFSLVGVQCAMAWLSGGSLGAVWIQDDCTDCEIMQGHLQAPVHSKYTHSIFHL